MKRIFLALTFILAMGFSTTAQAFSFDWGITGGYNLTKMKLTGLTNEKYNSENRSGWFLGAKANVGLFMGFGLDGAILYSQDKMNMHGLDEDNEYESKSETQRAFQIPINLKYSIGLGSVANIYATTGPQFDLNLGSDDWYNERFHRENVTTSWNVGLGAKFLKHFDVGIVYNFGISKFAETLYEDITNKNIRTDDVKSNSFKVQLTYYF